MGRGDGERRDRAGRVAEVAGADSAQYVERIQQLWGGYGEAARYSLRGAAVESVVVKHVQPGAGRGRSHDRKLRSYAVEQAWYEQWAARCGEGCRVPRALGCEKRDGGWLFVLEDLDASGLSARAPFLSDARLALCLRWLAAFHATFLGERPRGLWATGTYWHLQTRPDELRAMPAGALRDAAAVIDAGLSGARYRTFVHGDAKPANFCFARDGRSVAAVDFQYVGGGCGMKDVAYLLFGETRSATEHGLQVYFAALRERVPAADADDLEEEWRGLFPWACADFQRFLEGWDPGWRASRWCREQTQAVLDQL